MKQFKNLSIAAVLLGFAFSACSPEATSDTNSNSASDWDVREMRTEYQRITVEKVAGPFEIPWSVAFLPDGSYLVTERPGRLQHVKDGEITEITGLPEIKARGQGGLMEVLAHYDYENTGWIYLTYSKPNGNDETATALIRGKIAGNQLVEVEELFVQDRYSQPGRHYGSKLAWTTDGKLLMSIGDRGANPPRAQDLMDHAGTLLRLNPDGTVPADNPFVGRNNVRPEIFSYGHRNIQGLVVDPQTNTIWATEHGPRGGDELNRVEAAKNYGWPTVTLGWDYRTQGVYPSSEARQRPGMVDPIHEFLPTLAPSGLAMITTDRFPNWSGDLLAGGLRAERVLRMVMGDDEVYHVEELLLQQIGRIRDVREAPSGDIYVLNNASESFLYRISPGN